MFGPHCLFGISFCHTISFSFINKNTFYFFKIQKHIYKIQPSPPPATPPPATPPPEKIPYIIYEFNHTLTITNHKNQKPETLK